MLKMVILEESQEALEKEEEEVGGFDVFQHTRVNIDD
jgi:hypothetical protein